MIPCSVIIIAKNEAAAIRKCLESVADFEEIVVLDDESTDETVAIAREFPRVKIASRKMVDGFGPQKNHALKLATSDWVFSLDADERMTPELCKEITAAIGSGCAEGYRVRRRNFIFGAWLTDHAAVALRLFQRTKARFTQKKVDEGVVVDGVVKDLKNVFLHESRSHATIGAYFRVIVQKRSVLTAQDLFSMGRRVTPFSALLNILLRPFLIFLQKLIVKRGYTYGWRGFVLAFLSALTYFYSYIHLWKLQKKLLASDH